LTVVPPSNLVSDCGFENSTNFWPRWSVQGYDPSWNYPRVDVYPPTHIRETTTLPWAEPTTDSSTLSSKH
jgi:hypothetical protein